MLLIAFLFIQSPQTVFAGGFGVSGTFAGYDYKMVAGETSSSSVVTVIFYNQYDVAIDIRVNTEAPYGVTYLNLQTTYTIAAKSQLQLPIAIQLDDVITPGSYVLNVYAQVIPSTDTGITLIGSAGLQANLVVLGEAGMVNISVVSVNGLAFPAVLELFRVDEETMVSVALDEIEIVSQYAASDYLVRAYYESRQVAEQEFTLNNQDDITIELVAQTLLIQTFRVVPLFDNQSNRLTTAQISFELDNTYKPVTDVSVVLHVIHQQSLIEEVKMLQASVVTTGSTNGQFTYYPEQGWRVGEYTFELVVNNRSNTLDTSTSLSYSVPRASIDNPGFFEGRTTWLLVIFVLGGTIIGGWVLVQSKQRIHPRKPRNQTEKTTTFSQKK